MVGNFEPLLQSLSARSLNLLCHLARNDPMTSVRPIVVVIDDDPGIRDALQGLLETIAVDVETFESAETFLQSKRRDCANCIILDVRLPGPSGLDAQSELSQAKCFSPIIFITAHGDIPMSVRAMKAGALEFLTKPFRDQDLLDAVRQGINRDRVRREEERLLALIQRRFETLTAR